MTRWLRPILCCLLAASCPAAIAGPERARADAASRATPRAVEGTLTVVVEDDFRTGRSRQLHFLEERSSGRRYRLRFERGPAERLSTGAQMTVRGLAVGGELRVSEEPGAWQVETAPAAVSGQRSVLVLVADFSDSTVSCTDSEVADDLFDGGQSVDGLFQEGSYGALSLPRDTDQDGLADVLRVAIDATVADPCSPFDWADAADQAALDAAVDLSLFQHRVYVLPRNNDCGWSGLGTVGCFGACRAWIGDCRLEDIYAHELGHNLGMAHASTDEDHDGTIDCEYCDLSDYMGFSGVGWRQLGGPHRVQMGWIPPEQIEVATPGLQTHTLSSLATDPALAPFPQVLRIASEDPADPYYLSFREPVGYDAGLLSDYRSKTSIHRYPGGFNNTRFVTALADGESFLDSDLGLTVTQLSHAADSVTLQVTTAGTAPTPPVSLRASLLRAGSVHLSWSAGPGAAPDAYRVYRDGQLLVETSAGAHDDWTSVRGATHLYWVTAVDAAGQESIPGDTVQIHAARHKGGTVRPSRP